MSESEYKYKLVNRSDEYFITDLNDNDIIFKTYIETDENIFIKYLKEFINTQFSKEDKLKAENYIIKFYIDQFDDNNQLYGYSDYNGKLIPFMNPAMMKHWELNKSKVITVNKVTSMDGGSRRKNRNNITGGYICPNLIPESQELFNIYNNGLSITTNDEFDLYLKYVEKYQKELELYYAIKRFDNFDLEQIKDIYLSIENNEKLKYFIDQYFPSMKKM